jgi:hypothetical protein
MAAFDTKAEVPGRQLGFMETASGKLADVRYWPKAAALHMSAFGGKADITFCAAYICF